MIHKPAVLFRIQNLEQGGRRISLVVTRSLIDLIQKHQRILDTSLFDPHGDSSRHRSHISSSMSADFRLIAHTAKTDAHIFFIQCPCHRTGNGGLSGSRRSDQTENRRVPFLCERTHSQILHDTFLHLLQSIMILFQNRKGLLHIGRILRSIVPRQTQQCLNVSSGNGTLRTAAVSHALKTLNFF